MNDHEVIAYQTNHVRQDIVPAPQEREWMNRTPQKYAYRCLPLNIGNTLGWQILNESEFTVHWNGGPNQSDVVVTGNGLGLPISHFGCGTFTFHINVLFQTVGGVNMYVGPPTNQFLDGVNGLTGVVETDWAPYTFTMNWLVTRPNFTIAFPAGFPICQIFPIDLGLIERARPFREPLSRNPVLESRNREWSRKRDEFNAALAARDPAACAQGWQKDYFRGKGPGGTEGGATAHRTRLRVRPFGER